MAQYKISSATGSRFGNVAVVITCSFFNAGGYPRAESFVLLPDGKTVVAKRLRFDVMSFHDSPVELSEDFMLEQAFAQAHADLLHYVQNEGSGGHELSVARPMIKPGDLKLLVHLWVRKSCEHLVEVYQKTECEQLRDAIRPILKLPKISTHEF